MSYGKGWRDFIPPTGPSKPKPNRKHESAVPMLLNQLQLMGVPRPETEVGFHPTRKWRADLLWRTPKRLIVEVEGGVFIQGRHSRGAGMEEDAEKYAEALLLGFPVLRVTPRQVKRGQAVDWIARYFRGVP